MSEVHNLVRVEHPELTVGQLCQEIRAPTAPIKRSTHIGNQPAHELLLMTAFPPGIEMLMVDTIQGNDKYSSPRDIVIDREKIPLCTQQEAKGRIVGSIVVSVANVPSNLTLQCIPMLGESLSDFHSRAIDRLSPSNRPRAIVGGYFARYPDILQTAVNQAHALGETTRRADDTGTIVVCDTEGPEQVGIFGLADISTSSEGVLPSLNTMMAIDVLISAIILNSDSTMHLGGPDMIRYTRDPSRMGEVATIVGKTAAELGGLVTPHTYKIPDITGLKQLVPSVTHASQHQLLRAMSVVRVNLEEHADKPCGSMQ